MNFKDVYFGCSDAETEANRYPEVFCKVFFDPHENLKKLMFGDEFLLLGRKGDGKTAYGEQLRLESTNNNIYTYRKSLNNFNNQVFQQIKSTGLIGGNPYFSFWKCILMIKCVEMINTAEPHIQHRDFVNLVATLSENGFIDTRNDRDISVTITQLVQLDSTISIKSVFQHSRHYDQSKVLVGAEQIYASIKNTIQDLYCTEKFIFVIDGLDDVLQYSEFNPDIITGLIRATEEINRLFRKKELSLKIILFMRYDIFSLCRDPNLSKISRDSCIKLEWLVGDEPETSDLIKLVEKRMDAATGKENSFSGVWNEVFPEKINGKDTLDYVLENIIYRPRDILQFFIEVQKEYTFGKKLTPEKVQFALARYSNDYFVAAMADELTGFFPNEAVTQLPHVLSRMGEQYFYPEAFAKECAKYPEFKDVSAYDILGKLFVAGYIGQHRPREDRDYTVFSYRNPWERFCDDHECILHRGLMRALNI